MFEAITIKTTFHKKLSINQECQDISSNPSKDRELDIGGKVRDLDIGGDCDEDDDNDVNDQSDAAANDDDDQEDADEQEDDDQDDNDDDQDSDNDGDDFVHPKLSTHDEEAKDEESFDHTVQIPSQVETSDDESNDDDSHGMNVRGHEGPDAEDDDEEFYGDININLEGRDVQMTDVHITQVLEHTHVTLTPVNPNGQQQSSSVSSQFMMSMFNPSPDTSIDSLFESTPLVNVPVTTIVEPLLLTATTLPPPSIPTVSQVQQAPAPSPTDPSTFLQDLPNFGSLYAFNHRLKTLEASFSEFMQTNQFAEAISSIPSILEAEVLTRASNSSKTSYDMAADLSELELKKILIEKMERNKSIHQSDEQRNLYKALVDAYECDKIILDTYEDTVTLKIHRDDEDKDEEPSAGSDWGSKRRRAGAADDQPVAEASWHPEWFQMQMKPLTPDHAWNKTLPATHRSIQPWISDLTKQADSRTSFNELMHTLVEFSAFLMNRLKVDTLTPELLAGCHVIPFDHFINNDLEYLRGGASSRKYTTSVTKTKAADYGHIKESARDVYSKRRIIAVIELQIIEWHNYKHMDWITVRRDDDTLYKFKEGNLKRLLIQDIEDMLLLLVQGKLTNLIVKERFAFNVSLRMFTRSIIIQRRMEDLQLGVESYQKKLKLTKPNTYRSDLKRKEAYTAYSNPRGFIYQNKDKQNRLMRIDELHKFSDGTLNDVRTTLDDHLKGI
nr:hypothetical protein [Tanacetum cinerariifolium]